MFLQFRVWAKC